METLAECSRKELLNTEQMLNIKTIAQHQNNYSTSKQLLNIKTIAQHRDDCSTLEP